MELWHSLIIDTLKLFYTTLVNLFKSLGQFNIKKLIWSGKNYRMLKREHDKSILPSVSSEALNTLKETINHIKNQNNLLKNLDSKLLFMDSQDIAKALAPKITSQLSSVHIASNDK